MTEAVRLLTHDKNISYFEYIRAIKKNPVARAVKLADLEHNSDQSRITDSHAVSDEKREYWKKKYTRAREILEEPE